MQKFISNCVSYLSSPIFILHRMSKGLLIYSKDIYTQNPLLIEISANIALNKALDRYLKNDLIKFMLVANIIQTIKSVTNYTNGILNKEIKQSTIKQFLQNESKLLIEGLKPKQLLKNQVYLLISFNLLPYLPELASKAFKVDPNKVSLVSKSLGPYVIPPLIFMPDSSKQHDHCGRPNAR